MAVSVVSNGVRETFWRQQIELQKRSGMSQAKFCRGRGLVPGTFAWWKNQLKRRQRRRSAANPFIPVRVVPRPISSGFEVQLRSGRRIQVPCPFDADSLRQLVAILEATC